MVDWKAIFDAALDAGAATAKTAAPQIKAALKEVRGHHEAAIREIGTAFLDGKIDRATFESSMRDEATTLQNELLAVSVLSKAILQKAINAFRDALIEGIEKAVSAVF
jgi:hypothetical protein